MMQLGQAVCKSRSVVQANCLQAVFLGMDAKRFNDLKARLEEVSLMVSCSPIVDWLSVDVWSSCC